MAVPPADRLDPSVLLRLLRLLADARLHSGECAAKELRVSRAAVRQGVQRLRATGIDVQSVPGRGYRLAEPVELLDARLIAAQIDELHSAQIRTLELKFEVDSTNARLLGKRPPPAGLMDVCLTELQYAGRGRLGRRWIAPFGSGIALSAAWTFANGTPLHALSLAVGVSVARALERAGAARVKLKWPNDVWLEDRKIGGVLIELRTEAGGPIHAVIGVGVNVAPSAAAQCEFEAGGLRVAAVADACAAAPSRNRVAGAILDELLRMLSVFGREGFAAFKDAWLALDALRGRPAEVMLADGRVAGTACGVDHQGALLLDTGERLQRFVSGEASLRAT